MDSPTIVCCSSRGAQPGYNANAYLTIFSASHLKIANLSMFRLKQFAEGRRNGGATGACLLPSSFTLPGFAFQNENISQGCPWKRTKITDDSITLRIQSKRSAKFIRRSGRNLVSSLCLFAHPPLVISCDSILSVGL